MRLTYAWRLDRIFGDVDPNKVGNRLSKLEAEHGFISRAMVLEEGKDKNSPLYDLFERNPQTALEKWNTKRASDIINGLVVVKNGRKMKKSAFVYVDAPQSTRKAYVSLVVAMRSPTLREQVVERGAKEFLKWAEKYAGMPEFRGSRSAIRKVKKQIEEQLLLSV